MKTLQPLITQNNLGNLGQDSAYLTLTIQTLGITPTRFVQAFSVVKGKEQVCPEDILAYLSQAES